MSNGSVHQVHHRSTRCSTVGVGLGHFDQNRGWEEAVKVAMGHRGSPRWHVLKDDNTALCGVKVRPEVLDIGQVSPWIRQCQPCANYNVRGTRVVACCEAELVGLEGEHDEGCPRGQG